MHKETRRAKREKAISLLGGKCVVCGFDDIRALQVDHIAGTGKEERTGAGQNRMYNKILSGHAAEYQLLCANHNIIKRAEAVEMKPRGKAAVRQGVTR